MTILNQSYNSDEKIMKGENKSHDNAIDAKTLALLAWYMFPVATITTVIAT